MEPGFSEFFLNAMDAMKRGGELTVQLEIRSGDSSVTPLCLTTRTGTKRSAFPSGIPRGIKKEDIAPCIDRFFTTKDFGTGLGLSVVHEY